MKMLVLGERGMLGSMAMRYFASRDYELATIAGRYTVDAPDAYLSQIAKTDCDVVFNCVGAIKQRVSNVGELAAVNGLLPLALRACLPKQTILIQPSTDCVFDGTRGNYRVDEPRNAGDAYGQSKIMGECVSELPNTVVVRSSIIGPAATSYGLMQWYLSHADGAEVNGFTNHRWNGLTTLEQCRFVDTEILQGGVRRGIVQPGSAAVVTKAELLKLIGEVFERRINVKPTVAAEAIDRSLVPTHRRSTIAEQLRELRLVTG